MFKEEILERLKEDAVILPTEGEEEIWKEYSENPYYEVSSFGRIRNKRGYYPTIRANKDGYPIFFDSKTRKTVKVHRVVCEAFHSATKDDKHNQVDHIDKCRQNNYYKNLRWVTPAENIKNKKNKTRTSETWVFKDKTEIVLLDKNTNELIQEFNSPKEASEKLGLSLVQIILNIHGNRKPFRIGYFLTKKTYEEKLDKK